MRRFDAIRIFSLILVTFITVCFSDTPADPAGSDRMHDAVRVLIPCSFSTDQKSTVARLRGIIDTFGKSGRTVDPVVLYMDTKRAATGREYFSAYAALIREGYRGMSFRAIMTIDNDALDFMRICRDSLFPRIPLVFVALNNYTPAVLTGGAISPGPSTTSIMTGRSARRRPFCPAQGRLSL